MFVVWVGWRGLEQRKERANTFYVEEPSLADCGGTFLQAWHEVGRLQVPGHKIQRL